MSLAPTSTPIQIHLKSGITLIAGLGLNGSTAKPGSTTEMGRELRERAMSTVASRPTLSPTRKPTLAHMSAY